MKHRNLLPVDSSDAVLPVYYEQLQSWIDWLPGWFAEPRLPSPKATLLCGLPGVGKGTAAKVVAKTLGRPLFLLDGSIPLNSLNRFMNEGQPCVLWVDRPGEQHFGLIRWLQGHENAQTFVVFTSDAPHRLPPGFLRVDVVSSAWHLDLPSMTQRSALWGDLLAASIPGHHEHDSVKLAQMSPLFTPAEVRAAYDNALRVAGGKLVEGTLIESVLELKPLAPSMDMELACLRAWAHEHACSAASGSFRGEP